MTQLEHARRLVHTGDAMSAEQQIISYAQIISVSPADKLLSSHRFPVDTDLTKAWIVNV